MARAFEPELHTRCVGFDHQCSAPQETSPAQGPRDEHGTDLAQLSQSPGQDPSMGTLPFDLSLLNATFLSQPVLH